MHDGRLRVLAAACGVLLAGCASSGGTSDPPGTGSGAVPLQQLEVDVLSTRAHEKTAFTQGLEIDGGYLYESTGLRGRSYVQRSDLVSGRVLARRDLPEDLFGEGITVAGDRLWQITWQSHVAIARDPLTLAEKGRATYEGEGWGLCAQPDRLVMSDGSATLTFRDRSTFAALATVTVTADGSPVERLNELECTPDGQVWANVWQTNKILRIDPRTGHVTATVDASGLLDPAQARDADVLNGIAAVPGTDRFLITGKLWPTTFEVRFVPR